MNTTKRRSHKSGLAPGTLVHIGEQKTEKMLITHIEYDETSYEIREMDVLRECLPYKEKPSVTWLNIEGLHEVSAIEEMSSCYDLHPLTMEDILNTEQRPKVELFDKYIFFVIKMISYDTKKRKLSMEQVSLVLSGNTVITFQEKGGDVFDPVRNRLKNNKGLIRKSGADFLAYALLDAVVDEYFGVLEKIGDDIEQAEELLLVNPTSDTLKHIHTLKREMISLRKSVWPLREIINRLEHDETEMISRNTRIYLRDLYDHTIQVIDGVETHRDMISGMLDIYLSSVSNRMNEVMKVLAIFASLFIPLTFIAGVYGMNFNTDRSPFNMPELNWYFGYPFALGLMVATAVSLLFYFRRKKWF